MRVKCANCGMIYEVTGSTMEFRSERERFDCATCPKCGSNAKDVAQRTVWSPTND